MKKSLMALALLAAMSCANAVSVAVSAHPVVVARPAVVARPVVVPKTAAPVPKVTTPHTQDTVRPIVVAPVIPHQSCDKQKNKDCR